MNERLCVRRSAIWQERGAALRTTVLGGPDQLGTGLEGPQKIRGVGPLTLDREKK